MTTPEELQAELHQFSNELREIMDKEGKRFDYESAVTVFMLNKIAALQNKVEQILPTLN